MRKPRSRAPRRGIEKTAGGEPTAPRVLRVLYRYGLVDSLDDLSSVGTVDLSGDALTETVIRAIANDDILSAGGKHGDSEVGEPIQYDYLLIEHESATVEITVYNRAIMLFTTNDSLYPRLHRVFGAIAPNPSYKRSPG